MMETEEIALKNVGHLPFEVDPSLDLFEEIQKIKKEKNAIILAHYYQEPDIQDIADYIGDSLGLAQEAEKTKASIIAFAGVHFMSETAKILNPDKKVVLPDLRAGCSLSDSCPPRKFAEFIAKYRGVSAESISHPTGEWPNANLNHDYIVISYINCSAEIKAMSDIICTSSNAVSIVNSVPKDKKIIFAPDKNLGRYVINKTGRDMVLWEGTCMVHEIFSLQKITKLKEQHPNAVFIAHPECEEPVLQMAQFIGSTTALLKYTKENPAKEFIVATEPGIIHQMVKESPSKTFIPAPPDNNCACNECPHMKLNTLEKLYICLKYEKPEITMPEEIRQRAYLPIKRMLEISAAIKN